MRKIQKIQEKNKQTKYVTNKDKHIIQVYSMSITLLIFMSDTFCMFYFFYYPPFYMNKK